MMKNKIKVIFLISISLLMGGCWDYIGLDEITVITGVAIDKKDYKYALTFEYVDFNSSTKNKGVVTKIIESNGETIFDAIRNAKKKVRNKLYFIQTQAIIINKKIAEKDGIGTIINFFMRDGEIRETVKLVISEEKKASDILKAKSIDNPSTAYEIQKIVDDDKRVTGTTKGIALYETFNTIINNSESLGLPVIHLTNNDSKKVIEVNGIAVFKKDRAIGYLTPDESKMYLFINNSIEGGILPLKYKSKDSSIALEISENNSKQSYTYKDGKFKIKVETNTTVYMGEYIYQRTQLKEKDLKKIRKEAEKMIEKNIKKLIEKAQKEYKHDIFSFGNLIANKDSKLWHKVQKKWNKLFLTLDVEVTSNVKIESTALLR